MDFERKIYSGFFRQNKTYTSVAVQSENNHSKAFTILREKVYDNEDIDV